MKQVHGYFVVILALSVLAISRSNAQGEKKLAVKDLPAAVMAAFQKSYPNGKILGAGKETENGKTYYEVESMDGTVRRDLLYTPQGGVYEVEEAVAAASLPEAVKAAVQKAVPNAEIKKAEQSTHGTRVEFEMRVESGKTMHEIVVDPTGKVLKDNVVKSRNEKKEKESEEKEEEED